MCVCVCHSGFLGCEIPAIRPSAAAAEADADDNVRDDDLGGGGVNDGGRLKLTPQSKLTVISRPSDILLSFHSSATNPQVVFSRSTDHRRHFRGY